MHPHSTCTFSTFWLGCKSWLRERAGKTYPEVLSEVQDEYGRAFPLKAVWMLVSIVFFMVVIVSVLPSLAQRSAQAGLTSEALAHSSGTAAFLFIFSALGIWSAKRIYQLQQFCAAMCARGHRILAEQAA